MNKFALSVIFLCSALCSPAVDFYTSGGQKYKNVEVQGFDALLITFMRTQNAKIILRFFILEKLSTV